MRLTDPTTSTFRLDLHFVHFLSGLTSPHFPPYPNRAISLCSRASFKSRREMAPPCLLQIIRKRLTSSRGQPAETRSAWLCSSNSLNNLFLTSAAGLGGGGLDLYTWILSVATDVNSANMSPTVNSGPSATFSIGRGFQFLITILPLALGIRSLEYPSRTRASPTRSWRRDIQRIVELFLSLLG